MSSISLSKRLSNGAFAFLCVAVALYALSYLFVQHGFLSMKGELSGWLPWKIALHMHFLGGAVALGMGWSQFLKQWRAKQLHVHRILGKIYVASILLVTGPASLFLAYYATGGFNNVMGFGLMGLTWWGFTWKAYSEIRKGHTREHEKWMIRSFAVTLAALALRIEMPLMMVAGVPSEEAYQAISWLCWVPNLFVAEWIIGRKNLS